MKNPLRKLHTVDWEDPTPGATTAAIYVHPDEVASIEPQRWGLLSSSDKNAWLKQSSWTVITLKHSGHKIIVRMAVEDVMRNLYVVA